MGGRGSYGAAYRRRAYLTDRLSDLESQMSGIRDQAMAKARRENARYSWVIDSEGRATLAEWVMESYAENLAEAGYGELATARKKMERELINLTRGQRRLF